MVLGALLAFFLSGEANSAQAQDKAAKAARAHFQRAEKAYSLGKFEEALKGYEAAYEEKPLPGLLFNVAQCHRNLANHERAVFFYKRYLALEPEAQNRALVEDLIAEQEAKLAERSAAAEPTALAPASGPPRPDLLAGTAGPPADAATAAPTTSVTSRPGESPRPPVYKRWWFWGAAAVVVGGLAAALLIEREGPGPRSGLEPIDYR